MRRSIKKLALRSETIRDLSNAHARLVHGGSMAVPVSDDGGSELVTVPYIKTQLAGDSACNIASQVSNCLCN
jgi:hypothetical protein